MQTLEKKFEVSERRACHVVGQQRSSQRYKERACGARDALTKRLHELSRQHPRYGYRRMTALLRAEGWSVNRKRVARLWRIEGLRVPVKQRKRRRLGNIEGSVMRHAAEHERDVWSYDFVMDQTEDGRRRKMLPIVDEFTRQCLTVEVARSLTAQDVVGTLDRLFKEHGAPRFIRSDNGPEFIARAVKEWLAASGVATLYIEPGSPWLQRLLRVVQLALPRRAT